MNIIEAVKSGKPFKRSRWTDDCWLKMKPHKDGVYFKSKPCWADPNKPYPLAEEDIVSDDWIVKEEKVEVTVSDVREAFNRAWHTEDLYHDILKMLLKELGL